MIGLSKVELCEISLACDVIPHKLRRNLSIEWLNKLLNLYFQTVTEREVINGVLNVKNTKNHCLAYIRYINNINLQNLRKANLFLDIANRSLDNEASKLLANLRDERLPDKIETTNLQRYLSRKEEHNYVFEFIFLVFSLKIHGRMDWSRRFGPRNP